VQSEHIVKNRILRQLPADELKSVRPWLTPMQLRSNAVLQEPGDAIDHICFPLSGMISLLSVMQSGEQIETGIIGAEGLLAHQRAFGRPRDSPTGRRGSEDAQETVCERLSCASAFAELGRPLSVDTHDASAAECCLPRAPFSTKSALPLASAIPGYDWKCHLHPDARISFAYARGAEKYRFGRSPCFATSRADPIQARTYHYSQPRRSRGLRLRMLFGDPR
jgi:hypothetical protein